jgi:hypothetical protein
VNEYEFNIFWLDKLERAWDILYCDYHDKDSYPQVLQDLGSIATETTGWLVVGPTPCGTRPSPSHWQTPQNLGIFAISLFISLILITVFAQSGM